MIKGIVLQPNNRKECVRCVISNRVKQKLQSELFIYLTFPCFKALKHGKSILIG